jgi:diaminopimelate decarboxylase
MPTDTPDAATTSPDAPYRDLLAAEVGDARIWDYLRYDDAGDLWVNGLRVADALARYGAPLEIVDATLVERRCTEWRDLARSVAAEVGYPGDLDFFYAAKANMASEVVHAAFRSGWHAETSSRQDLFHLAWLHGHGLLPRGLRVLCNGFKLPPASYTLPHRSDLPEASEVALPPDTLRATLREMSYAEAIIALARAGWAVTPVLDAGELEAFAAGGTPPMDVGLRLKFGAVADDPGLDALVSRFGHDRRTLATEADAIARTGHLRLTLLHAMVGAAETIPVERFATALLLAGDVWFELRRRHASLVALDIGGGIPPLGEPYDHRGLLRTVLGGLKARAAAAGLPAPDVVFELGSLVAAECGFHVFRVAQVKRNHVARPGAITDWAILDGGLMAAIPDMLLIGKAFRFLAVEGANAPARRVRLGDTTCDSDGRYPPEAFGADAGVWLPNVAGPQHILIQGVGAYQEILAGVRGAHHCGLLEAVELILERRGDGRVHGRLMPRQNPRDAAAVLGYHDDAVEALREALAASPL